MYIIMLLYLVCVCYYIVLHLMVHAYKGGREGEGREGEGSTPHNLELHSTYIYCTGKLSLLPCPQVSLHADVAIQAIYVAKLTIDEYD